MSCLEREKFQIRTAANLEFCDVNLQSSMLSRYHQHNDIARQHVPLRRLGVVERGWQQRETIARIYCTSARTWYILRYIRKVS